MTLIDAPTVNRTCLSTGRFGLIPSTPQGSTTITAAPAAGSNVVLNVETEEVAVGGMEQ